MDQPATLMEATGPAESIGASTVATLKQMLAIIRRRKALLIAGLALVYVLGALYYFSRDFLYEAHASVLVHRTGDALSGRADDIGSRQPNYMPTQIRLITSAAVLNKAINKLNATEIGSRANLNADGLAAGLEVTAQKDTEILNIAYSTTDPRIAVAVVEAVVVAYLEFVNETHRSTSKEILQILTQQRDDLDRQLRDKESQLVEMQQSAGVLTVADAKGEKSSDIMARVMSLNQALSQAQMKRLELETNYQAVKTAIDQGEPIEPYLLRHRDRLGQIVNTGILAQRQREDEAAYKELMRDQLELERLRSTYGPNHPRVKMLEERVRLSKQLIEAGEARLAQTEQDLPSLLLDLMAHDLAAAKALEQELQNQFEQNKKAALDFTAQNAPLLALETDVNRLRNFYAAITDRIRQVNLGEDYGTITTQVVEPPQEPRVPVSPSLRKVGLTCTALGLLFGLALCYLFEWWDTSFRSPEDIASHLGLPVFGHVPRVEGRLQDGQPFELIMHHCPRSTEAESFRTLRAALMLCESPPKKFTITSPEPGDGKTSLVTNLGIAFAQSGLRTLLIDADMRRPRLRSIFQLARTSGLSQLLQQSNLTKEHLLQAIQPTMVEKLDVLPSGPNPPNPAELLTSANVEKILAWAEGRYERVVFDAPPILAVSDCAVLGRLLEGALLVVRADKSDRVMTLRARDALRAMNCPVLGVVVNNVHADDSYGYAYYRKSGYYAAYRLEQAQGSDSSEKAETEALSAA